MVGAAWFLAERRVAAAVTALVTTARATTTCAAGRPPWPRWAPSATRAGCPAVIEALDDKPTVRRRATVALAGFDDPRVEPALRRSAEDRDWQVRQAADELLEDDADAGRQATARTPLSRRR